MSTPLVSIIIPTYNRAHLIGETLDAVLAQTYQNWECLVVDDGSTDTTAALLAQYTVKDARFKYYQRPKTYLPGGNGARNYGFEKCTGDYVNWFDDDDVMANNFITDKLSCFKANTQFIISSYHSLEPSRAIPLKVNTTLFKDYLLWKFKIITNCVLFKKTFLNHKDLFDEHLKRGQETDLFTRLFFKIPTDSYQITNKSLFFYRQHDTSKTSKNLKYISDFKASESKIAMDNLKRGIILQDLDVINYCYKRLITFFFKAIRHKDSKVARYIWNSLLLIYKDLDRKMYLEFLVIGYFYKNSYITKGSYFFEKRWKTYFKTNRNLLV